MTRTVLVVYDGVSEAHTKHMRKRITASTKPICVPFPLSRIPEIVQGLK